jgi:hypothetical protein
LSARLVELLGCNAAIAIQIMMEMAMKIPQIQIMMK